MRPGFLTHMTDGRGGGYIEKSWGGAMEKSIWLLPSLGCCLGEVRLAAGERPEYKALGSYNGLTTVCAKQGQSTPHLEEVGKRRGSTE